MQTRRLVVAALLLLGLVAVTLEESFVHSDDGCAVETHCSACLLLLGTPGIVTVPFSLPRNVVAVDRIAPASPLPHEDAASPSVSSRGPPRA
jgi:hypothetical protein